MEYPVEGIMNSDDLAFLANTPVQSESQLHRMEQVAIDNGLYMN